LDNKEPNIFYADQTQGFECEDNLYHFLGDIGEEGRKVFDWLVRRFNNA